MGILTYIRDAFFPWAKQKDNLKDLETYCYGAKTDIAFKIYAINIAISKIANAISICDFETYKDKKYFIGDNWWLLNVEPNINQDKYKFWQEVIYQLVFNPEGALIVQSNEGHLICAKNFNVTERTYIGNTYSEIELKGFEAKGVRTEKNVIHLTLNNNKVKSIIDGVYESYGELITGSVSNYNRGNAMKLILKLGSLHNQFGQVVNEETGETEADTILDDILENRMSKLMSEANSVTPLEDGLELEEISTSANTKSGAVTTRDITATFDDIMNLVADAFHIPRGLMKGDVADVEAMTQNFITFAIEPIVKQIEAELNRKMYGKDEYLKGNKIKVDASSIVNKDPVKFASSAEALLRIGTYCINDILRKLGEDIIDEEWAWQRFITKNYEGVNKVDEEKTEDKESAEG